ncbi:ATP-binding cassette domain-containing protein [Actinoplanes sp. NEAU-A12]|uniref:ATP-binding cassette domain-containing protein n=1 Tax=Actinoplanes sandaracinus TaxID=3045177 RepID=A0ABT6WTK1_9ACTN|nr:ATP-binding cassette domain-containing protein [Actinoplanes sandaracinus]MDI6103076.1 ATP-binding cassette domain-containing protein [Actinoplanes sandaracinus]
MSDVLLRLTGVSVRHEVYGEDGSMSHGPPRPQEVSAELRAGEVVLLLGPSGCGKSTLTLTTNGLIPQVVTSRMDGTVTVAGVDTTATTVPGLAADVAMVFQDPDAQIVTATLFDEVCFGPENLLLPVGEVLGRAEEALRRVGLWERRDDDPEHLSGGGRQRLAIACALALRTPVLVLDEPTANLDPAGVEEVYRTLREIAAERDRAVLLVEHNLDAAIDFVDRVIVLDAAGRVVLDGPARTTLIEHVDELVALGVWLPVATLAALRLRAAGIAVEPLPLTPRELAAVLDEHPTLPPPRARSAAESTPEPSIRVRNLTVHHGRHAVLHDVSLTVRAGEFVAVAGANGAGKTTLAQAIAGVAGARRGAVTVTGPAGFVFQNPEHQFLTNRVEDELAYGMRVLRLSPAEIGARVDDLLDRLGLRELRTVHPFLLSGGQKRRLSVGTALVTRPKVLVLDEPTFGQDRERAAELLDLLDALHRDGTTVVVVSHDMHLVAEYATRLLVLAEGRVIADGPPAEVYADAAVLAAAGLRPPPIAQAVRALTHHPEWHGLTRLADLPACETAR